MFSESTLIGRAGEQNFRFWGNMSGGGDMQEKRSKKQKKSGRKGRKRSRRDDSSDSVDSSDDSEDEGQGPLFKQSLMAHVPEGWPSILKKLSKEWGRATSEEDIRKVAQSTASLLIYSLAMAREHTRTIIRSSSQAMRGVAAPDAGIFMEKVALVAADKLHSRKAFILRTPCIEGDASAVTSRMRDIRECPKCAEQGKGGRGHGLHSCIRVISEQFELVRKEREGGVRGGREAPKH